MEKNTTERTKQHSKKRLFLWVLIFVVIIIVIVAVRYFSLFWGLTVDRNVDVKQTKDGRINVLLLGKGGGNHDGPDLTDTIMLVSINPEKNKVTMISIPRDLYISSTSSKINRIYSDGQSKGGQGLLLLRSAVQSITGVHPDYAVIIDFSGFEKLIDLLGGIDVKVENTLDDYAYPIEGNENELCGHTEDGIASFSAQIATASATELEVFPCRFEHLHVDEGIEHMDGQTALQFVRSRHALGSEGTDFARSKRQQNVIQAIREKVLSLGTLANPLKVMGIVGILKENISTDIQEKEYDDFIKLAQKMKGANIESYVLDIGDEAQERQGLLVNPPISEEVGFQWVLVPRSGVSDYSEIKEYIGCLLSEGSCEITEAGVVIKKQITPTPTL